MTNVFKTALTGSETYHASDATFMTRLTNILTSDASQLGPFGSGIRWDDVPQGNQKVTTSIDDWVSGAHTFVRNNGWKTYIQSAIDADSGIPWFDNSTPPSFPDLGSNADHKYVVSRTNSSGVRKLFEGFQAAADPAWPSPDTLWAALAGYDSDAGNSNRSGWWDAAIYGGGTGKNGSGVLGSGAKIDSILWTPAQYGSTPSHKLGLEIAADSVSSGMVNGALRTDGSSSAAYALPYGAIMVFDHSYDLSVNPNSNAVSGVIEKWLQQYGAILVDALPPSSPPGVPYGGGSFYVQNDASGWQTATGLTTTTQRKAALHSVRWDKCHILTF